MKRPAAVLASVVHFAAAPGVVVGVVPWLLTGWHPADPGWPLPVRIAGAILLAVGVCVLVAEFARFVREGEGSPAPPAPTRVLVTGGLYAHVRNPMYLAVVGAIVGQAALLGRPGLLVYAASVALVCAAFVHLYEEPTLARTYQEQYDRYREDVPRWLPRLRARSCDRQRPISTR
jgi:protein-S-isoprenylcysteine O-methyltransferase Ste14